MHQVQHERITNKAVLAMFDLPPMIKSLRKRQHNWAGKIARMNETRLPKRILTAWCPTIRKRGRPIANPRTSIRDLLTDTLPGITEEHNGAFRSEDWFTCAQDLTVWDDLYYRYRVFDE